AAGGPVDLDGVTDFQAGEGDHHLLAGLVDLVVGVDVAHADVRRGDRQDAAGGLVDAGLVQRHRLVGRGGGDGVGLAELGDAVAAVEADDLLGGRLDGAVGLDAADGAGVEDAGRGVVEVLRGDGPGGGRLVAERGGDAGRATGHRPSGTLGSAERRGGKGEY